MKKTYLTPDSRTVMIQGPALMTGGSMKVNSFKSGSTITIGDSDEETKSSNVRANRNYVDWDN